MKKLPVLCLLVLLILAGCSPENTQNTITIFAASSLTEVLEEISTLYQKEKPEVKIIFTFDSSGSLKSQIEAGAKGDIFISAAQKPIEDLLEKGLIVKNSKLDLLSNSLIVAKRPGLNFSMTSLDDLESEEIKKIGLGNADVPVGYYSQGLLQKLGLLDKLQGKISLASNVKEVTTWLKEGLVDVGIVYKTDGRLEELTSLYEIDSSLLDEKVIYPLGLLSSSQKPDEALAFIDFLKTKKAEEVFTKAGFTIYK